MCELPLLTWLRESLLCVNNSQIHFYSFDSDRKISSTPMLVHAQISNLPTHLANVCQPQPDTIMQVTKKLYRWEYFANTFNSQNIWWFCFPASGLWIKEYLWPIPQVQKVKKKMQLPTGLNLQPGRLVTLYAKLSQTWPFRAKSLSGYEQQQQSLPIKHTLVRFCRIFFFFFLTYRFQKEERSIFPALKKMLNWRGRYLIVDYGLSFNAIPKKSEGRGGGKKNKKKLSNLMRN